MKNRLCSTLTLLFGIFLFCSSAEAALTLGVVSTSSPGAPESLLARQLSDHLSNAVDEPVGLRAMASHEQLHEWLNHYAMLDLALMPRRLAADRSAQHVLLGFVGSENELALVARHDLHDPFPKTLAAALSNFEPLQPESPPGRAAHLATTEGPGVTGPEEGVEGSALAVLHGSARGPAATTDVKHLAASVDESVELDLVYVLPFVSVMVPDQVVRRAFEQFLSTMNSLSAQTGLLFRATGKDAAQLDPHWLAKQKYMRSEMFGYVENTGYFSGKVSARLRVSLYNFTHDAPVRSFEVATKASFDEDNRNIASERENFSDKLAADMADEFTKAIKL